MSAATIAIVSAAPTPWYVATTGNHQRIIIDENTGKNIAVAYEAEHAPLLAAAPELLAALQRTLNWLTSYPGGGTMGKTGPYEQARAAIEKARGT